MRALYIFILMILSLQLFSRDEVLAQTPQPTPIKLDILEKDEELRDLFLNLNSKFPTYLPSNMWMLTHAYESKDEVDRVLNYFTEFLSAVNSNDKKKIGELGGARGFKDKFVYFTASKDDAVRAFSAIMLGMAGDKSYAPFLAKLINERDESFSSDEPSKMPGYRGRACVGIAMLGAKDYKADISKLLVSKNDYDRSGAIIALGELQATEYTKDIVRFLNDQNYRIRDDDSPLHFLIETKQARKYKNLIVSTMLKSSDSEVVESAAYALVAIDAKEHAPDVAKLLQSEFRKGTAAKVLALLGARQYVPRIARLLSDKSSLVRADAVAALAILDAKQYAPRIAALITKRKDDFVSVYAAEAILLMGAKAYYPKAQEALAFKADKCPYRMAGDFHTFVTEKAEAVRVKLQKIINETCVVKTN